MIFDTGTFLIFLLEIFLGTILVFYIKIADDWAVETIALIKKETPKTIDLIKDIRADVVKLNKILNIIKNFKLKRLKNIVTKIFDAASILVLLHPGGTKKFKFVSFAGLRVVKRLLSLLKPA